ncbi:hypothetical protein D3C86_2174010 [compost metagenome]
MGVHLPGTRHRHGQQDRVPDEYPGQLQGDVGLGNELVLHSGPGRPDLRDGRHADQVAPDCQP